ncbi:MAG TPA: hypothetical protein VGL58_13250 [Caulobacteraceae bacterium]|jgi:hypothetical protein
MRVLIAGILGGIAMYVWASAAHLSPLAQIGVHSMPNEGAMNAALSLNLGDHAGVYVYPGPSADGKMASAPGKPEGLLSYTPHGSGGLSPRQLGVEFALELAESLLLAFALANVAGFGARFGVAVLVGLIAAVATNVSYWNWYGFGADYTLANAFIELMKFVVAGLVIALLLRRRQTP